MADPIGAVEKIVGIGEKAVNIFKSGKGAVAFSGTYPGCVPKGKKPSDTSTWQTYKSDHTISIENKKGKTVFDCNLEVMFYFDGRFDKDPTQYICNFGARVKKLRVGFLKAVDISVVQRGSPIRQGSNPPYIVIDLIVQVKAGVAPNQIYQTFPLRATGYGNFRGGG
ncbi:MAG: hypothetical protein AAGC57_07690 [Pseudomonadota bacterium]